MFEDSLMNCRSRFFITTFLVFTRKSVDAPLPLPTFNGKNMTKSHTKWLQDIEISVYLPIFSLKNFILGLLNDSAPGAFIRIKTVLILLARNHS